MGERIEQSRMSRCPPEDVGSVTVVGGGTIGHGIAQTFATSGYDVVLNNINCLVERTTASGRGTLTPVSPSKSADPTPQKLQ
jgi:3-hydroxyacyl-CoA dehydrogenase